MEGVESSLCPVIQRPLITHLRFYHPRLSDKRYSFSSLRSSLQMSAPKQRGVTGTWSTSAVLSARLCLGASATSWRKDGPTAAPASSHSTQSTATPVGSILVCCWHLSLLLIHCTNCINHQQQRNAYRKGLNAKYMEKLSGALFGFRFFFFFLKSDPFSFGIK